MDPRNPTLPDRLPRVGYYLKTSLGAVLFIGALIAFNYALLNLLESGTCASGNTPYEIAKPCPPGTGKFAAILVGSIFGGLIGAGIFAFRGDPPGRSRPPNGAVSWGLVAWGLFFGGTGLAALIGSFTGDLPADGKTGGVIVGITFVLMGVPVLLFLLWGAVKGLFERGSERPAMGGPVPGPGRAPAARGGSGDPIDRIARLDELRCSGALSRAEFDREKAKILSEG